MNKIVEYNQIIEGDSLTVLKTLPDESVNCCVTSPPYWGLRDYGIEPTIWDGVEGCEHEWGNDIKRVGNEYRNDKGNLNGAAGKKVEIAKLNSAISGNFCLRCNAWRGSLGLEPTFELYIKHLCDIFDEVKRVLRKDGTCWVNLGDSYSGSGKGIGTDRSKCKESYTDNDIKKSDWNNINISPKSLCLIPQRFAIEMVKRRGFIIPNENDRAWLAGIIEGEGCIHIHKRQNGRKNPTYGVFLSIHNTNINMIERIKQLTGLKDNVQTTNKDRGFTLYRWNAMSNNGKNILREVYPYLVTKRDQARCAIHCPSSGKEAEECWINIKRMHNYQEVNKEYPEPQIGGIDPWILRNTIIWKKPNCMPSSAKDRFTVDFEYVYFFVKNKSYWFEQVFEAWTDTNPNDTKRAGKFIQYNGKWKDDNSNRSVVVGNPAQGRNKRAVWTITTKPFKEAHFATFPEALIEPMIQAGCPRYVCKKCGKAREKIILSESKPTRPGTISKDENNNIYSANRKRYMPEYKGEYYSDCGCNAGFEGGVVLDPFMGAGTTAVVAKKQGNRYLGIELKQEYIDMANKRIRKIPELLF